MQARQQFDSSESEEDPFEVPHTPCLPVSVLKHLPAARQILEGQNKSYELFSPRCLYKIDLGSTLKHIYPSAEHTDRRVGGRLISMEDAVFEYAKMKERIGNIFDKKQKESTQTLWDIYNDKQMYYSRFDPAMRKNNYANVFINIGGVNLDARLRGANFPQIRPKHNQQSQSNQSSVFFDSHFQSGNLLYAYRSLPCQNDKQVGGVESYDLLMHNDTNTRGHNQWFYFKVTSTRKNQKVRLNLVNFVKKQSLFSYGLKPLTFSQKQNRKGTNWVRTGHKTYYQANNIKKEYSNESYNTLSFQYQFQQPYDTVYFTPSYPYTYTQLLLFMNKLLNTSKYYKYISIKKLCQTVGKNIVNIITIATGQQNIESKVVWILGRQHPVQTTSSYMLQGIVTYLLDTIAEGNNNGLLDNYVFKIVPMVNPDGVIHGNTRAQLTGIDPNRVWKKPSKHTTPAIYHIKKHILKHKETTSLVLDLHSHSKKLGCFFYGNYSSSDVASFRLLPSTVCLNDPRFSYRNCRFRGGNQSSARRSLFKQLGISNIFTVECSLLGYLKDNRITEYKIRDYHQMGSHILNTFLDLESSKATRPAAYYPHAGDDVCDAQSARSDSCVSQEEYQEVYHFTKNKKKVYTYSTNKKNKPRSNTLIYKQRNTDHDMPSQSKIQYSSVKPHDQFRSQTLVQRAGKDRLVGPEGGEKENLPRLRAQHKRDFSIKFTKVRTLPKTTPPLKKINQTTCHNEETDTLEISEKTFGEKSVQVQELRGSGELAELRQEKKLMVWGSTLQEDKVCVGRGELGKSEVGIQLCSPAPAKENLTSPEPIKSVPSSKVRLNQRRVLQVADNRGIRDRRNPLMFRN